jgi:putative ABC transport system permease protein
MFLGYKEIQHEKLRYLLLAGMMMLIALVVFVLSGLANGLSRGNRLAVDHWQAKYVYLSKDANKNIMSSQLTTANLNDISGKDKAAVIVDRAVVSPVGMNKKIDVSVIATTRTAFLLPKIDQGQPLKKDNQVIISADLVKAGLKVGNKIRFGANSRELTIVGRYAKDTLSIFPTVYVDLNTAIALSTKAQTSSPSSSAGKLTTSPVLPYLSHSTKEIPQTINAVVTKSSHLIQNDDLVRLSTQDFINNLPGYSAEQTTLNMMIYFLFVMALAIVGIFMYVLVLQKKSLFAVMKVEGISTGHIEASVLTQAFLLSLSGVIVGLILTMSFGAVLPVSTPFSLNYFQLAIYMLSLIAAALLGSLFSWYTIAKIDPVVAIG